MKRPARNADLFDLAALLARACLRLAETPQVAPVPCAKKEPNPVDSRAKESPHVPGESAARRHA